MDIRTMRYFLTVANEQNITKAALSLHISQPALSRQLKELEEELGVVLFIRGNRKIQLTEAGYYLANRAQEMITLFEKIEANLKQDEIISGEIYIGCGETEAMRVVVKALKTLIEKYPEIKISLYSGNADDLTEKLDNGILDFGLVIEPTNKQKYQYLSLAAKDQWGLLVNKQSELASKDTIQPDDLKNVPLIVSRQTFVDNQISDWLGESLANYHVVATYNLLYNASLLVKENIGAALCIDGIINTAHTELTFIPLAPKLEASLHLIWKKEAILSNAAKKLLELLTNSK